MSLLKTQDRLHKLHDKRRALEERLTAVNRQIMEATKKHREQIAVSLQSKNPTEREMAQRVADFWEVPNPNKHD